MNINQLFDGRRMSLRAVAATDGALGISAWTLSAKVLIGHTAVSAYSSGFGWAGVMVQQKMIRVPIASLVYE